MITSEIATKRTSGSAAFLTASSKPRYASTTCPSWKKRAIIRVAITAVYTCERRRPTREQCGGRRGERGERGAVAHVEILDLERSHCAGDFPCDRQHEGRPLEEEHEEELLFLLLLDSRGRGVVRVLLNVQEARRVSDVLVKLVHEIDDHEEREEEDEGGLRVLLEGPGAGWGLGLGGHGRLNASPSRSAATRSSTTSPRARGTTRPSAASPGTRCRASAESG